jgi:hypothetical protein
MAAEKKRRFGRVILILVIQALFIISNPNPKMHLDYIRGIILSEIDLGSSSMNRSLNELAETIIGQDLINNYLNMYFKRTSYLLFSVTEKQVEGEWQIMAVGVLGNIITWSGILNELHVLMIKIDTILEKIFKP